MSSLLKLSERQAWSIATKRDQHASFVEHLRELFDIDVDEARPILVCHNMPVKLQQPPPISVKVNLFRNRRMMIYTTLEHIALHISLYPFSIMHLSKHRPLQLHAGSLAHLERKSLRGASSRSLVAFKEVSERLAPRPHYGSRPPTDRLPWAHDLTDEPITDEDQALIIANHRAAPAPAATDTDEVLATSERQATRCTRFPSSRARPSSKNAVNALKETVTLNDFQLDRPVLANPYRLAKKYIIKPNWMRSRISENPGFTTSVPSLPPPYRRL